MESIHESQPQTPRSPGYTVAFSAGGKVEEHDSTEGIWKVTENEVCSGS